MLEMTSWLLQNIGALILASLVWLELKTGLVLGSFGLFDRHPHIVCASLFILGLLLMLACTQVPAAATRTAAHRPLQLVTIQTSAHTNSRVPTRNAVQPSSGKMEEKGNGRAIPKAPGVWDK